MLARESGRYDRIHPKRQFHIVDASHQFIYSRVSINEKSGTGIMMTIIFILVLLRIFPNESTSIANDPLTTLIKRMQNCDASKVMKTAIVIC